MGTKAWKGLLNKEFQITKRFLFVSLTTILGMIASVIFLTMKKEEPMIAFSFATVLFLLNSFYLLIYMAISLHVEAKGLHLWLHNPQSSFKLLFAKLLNGLLALVFSIFITGLFLWYIAAKVVHLTEILGEELFYFAAFSIANVLGVAIYSAVWFILIWTIYQIMKRKLKRELTIIFVIALISIPTVFVNLLLSTGLLKQMVSWGAFKLGFLDMIVAQGQFQLQESYNTISIGFYTFYTILTIVLFLLSNWLIDRKVEV